MYAKLLLNLKENGYHTVIGVISGPNEASVKLHKYFGFKKRAKFTDIGFKFNKWVSNEFWQLMLEDFNAELYNSSSVNSNPSYNNK